MTTMTNDETYNGYANRETWAFNLHWSNDYGLYQQTLEVGWEWLESHEQGSDRGLGEHIVNYWRDYIEDYEEETGARLPSVLEMFYREVGSWWRVDTEEAGRSLRESITGEG